MAAIATYTRAGGMPPPDDERLEIDADGSWRLWRTMGGARVGAFAGRLSADRRRRLARAIEATAAAGRGAAPGRARPDSAHEAFRAGRHALDVVAGRPVEGGWASLVGLLRRWSESLASAADATAALELELTPSRPVLARLGDGSLRVWPATLRVDLYARDRRGIVVEQATAGAGADEDAPRGEAITTGAGWRLPVETARALAAPAGGRVEAWARLEIDGPDGPIAVRLVASRAP